MKVVKLTLEHPVVQALLAHYFKKWGINPASYAPPASWIGAQNESGKTLAVIGFTVAPDKRIAYVSDVLCIPSRKGVRAMVQLVREFGYQAYTNGIESVCAQCLYGNEVMRKYLEHIGLRPLSVVYAINRKEFEHGWRG